MACNWRIRHKLILGMSMIAVIMALLLGGTLHGLASYRVTIGTCQSKVEELEKLYHLKEEARKLYERNPDDSQQIRHLEERLEHVDKAMQEYKDKLKDTADRGRLKNWEMMGKQELDYLQVLAKDRDKLGKALKDIKPVANGPANLLDEQSPIREALDEYSDHLDDLIGTIVRGLNVRFNATRGEARKSIMLLISTGILAVLMVAGLLRFFYRWVAQPISELEQGVSRVAHGDFQYRIAIKSGDEIEDLAKSYNDMTDKLRAMYENLAQQVNERSRQLVRSERLAGVGFLAAGVAHEINNPLASIAFCGEALESRLSDALSNARLAPTERETIAKYLKMIQEEAFRCKEITEKLLTFSRGGDLKREPTDLAEIIQGVIDVVQHLQNCKGKTIAFQPHGPIMAWANAQEVKQVFLNLVVNALESMNEGGVLTITHANRDGMVELLFKDTGCGMTPDVLENIFEPFFTRSRTGKGTGLGLSICHRIITQHGGEIEATSEGVNKGSTFRVLLPQNAPANAPESTQEVQDPKEEFRKLSSAKRNSRAA